jgi:hypothetical protein
MTTMMIWSALAQAAGNYGGRGWAGWGWWIVLAAIIVAVIAWSGSARWFRRGPGSGSTRSSYR